MEDARTDQEWSERVARYAASTLIDAGVLPDSLQEKATAIIAEEVLVRLIAGDRPPRQNRPLPHSK
jgi:hypothetical protein